MFTGLIQSVGTVNRRDESLIVKGYESFAPLSLGDSIAVDGVCLTVSDFFGGGFLADISEETLERTTLNMKSRKGSFVNLEPAIRLSDRLGGHLVSGHIDGMGKVVSFENLKNSWNLKLSWDDSKYCKYMCDKASISVNGISLTISDVYDEGCKFSVAVIPHTWTNTCLKFLAVGEKINLEVDIMAKYAEKLLKNHIKDNSLTKNNSIIDSAWLNDHGWM